MIRGAEDISRIFSIFHDGSVSLIANGDHLALEIWIPYLAKRVDSVFTKFYFDLHEIRGFTFVTWPNDPDAEPERLTEPTQVFGADLEIFRGAVEGGRVKVTCLERSDDFSFGGGDLFLEVAFASVRDERGHDYSIDELSRLSSGYWEEWKAKKRKS